MIHDVSERIKVFNASLLQSKIKIKYKFMAEGPYRFFRGTCHLFYEDLVKANFSDASPKVWMCGDLHVENLGTYKGDNRLIYFDLNDFDEAILGPANWELVRMVTSIFVAFESMQIEEKKALNWAKLFLDTYFKILSLGKARYIERGTAQGIVKTFIDGVCKRKQKELIKKHCQKRNGHLKLEIDNIKHFKIEKELKWELKDHIEHWIKTSDESPYNFEMVDACFRVAGTGSLGVKRYLFLLKGTKLEKDYLLLDMKQATSSSLIPYLKLPQPLWQSEANRTVAIQERVQNIPPALLSTTEFKNDSYVMQEMQPVEDKVDFNLIKNSYRDVCEVITTMALLTASAHLRSGGRQGSALADELISFGASGGGHEELINYGKNYALQVKNDYQNFLEDYNNNLIL
ncbi:MAG: DUF2252 domain-containing protein [Flavisolibacter sp.]